MKNASQQGFSLSRDSNSLSSPICYFFIICLLLNYLGFCISCFNFKLNNLGCLVFFFFHCYYYYYFIKAGFGPNIKINSGGKIRYNNLKTFSFLSLCSLNFFFFTVIIIYFLIKTGFGQKGWFRRLSLGLNIKIYSEG